MKPIFFLIVLAFLSACAPKSSLTTTIKPQEIQDVQQFETVSHISFIDRGNEGVYSKVLSDSSKKLMMNVLNDFKDSLRITRQFVITDTSVKKRFENELMLLCLTAEQARNTSKLKITPLIDSLLEQQGKRFGLLTFSAGFTRDKGNYAGQTAKSIGIGLLSLGMFVPVPIKCNSTIYAFVVDAQENNVAFSRKSFYTDEEPLKEKTVRGQINQIFLKGYNRLSPRYYQ